MTVRFDTFFTDYTRHFADAASRANRLALESAESALDVQLRVFESNTTATASKPSETRYNHCALAQTRSRHCT